MHEDMTPETEIGDLRTSLKVKEFRKLPLGGIGLPTQGPVRSYAESRACGKVIIAGEHAVVYGAKALAVPLLSKVMNLKLYADPQVTATPKIRVNLGERPANDSIKLMIADAFDVLGIARFNLSMEGHTSLMLGAGVGSSASLCVSVLRGLSQLSGRSVTPIELAKMANQLERRFHGNPSGLDTAVVSLEQAILFERGKDPDVVPVRQPKDSRYPWAFVLLDSGVRSPTINMVKHAEPVFRSKGQSFIEEFNGVTMKCKEAFENGDTSLMADALNHAHVLLTEVGVVDSVLHEICRTATAIGVRAVKVTGAGGGGCMLALLDNNFCDDQNCRPTGTIGKRKSPSIFYPLDLTSFLKANSMSAKKITIAYSPDTDDQFMILALKDKLIPWGSFDFEFIIADIQELNEFARTEKYDITAISVAAYPTIKDSYLLMSVGGSVGDEFGPAIVVRPDSAITHIDQLAGKRIAVPGLNTSAHIAAQGLFGPFDAIPTYFMDIKNAVLSGDVDAGILIHELQLNPASQGLNKLSDLGRLWYDRHQLPLPLGANAIKKSLGARTISELNSLYRSSIEYALARKSVCLEKAINSAIAKSDLNMELGETYISMYVNERSLRFQTDTITAIEKLFASGAAQGLIPSISVNDHLADNLND